MSSTVKPWGNWASRTLGDCMLEILIDRVEHLVLPRADVDGHPVAGSAVDLQQHLQVVVLFPESTEFRSGALTGFQVDGDCLEILPVVGQRLDERRLDDGLAGPHAQVPKDRVVLARAP